MHHIAQSFMRNKSFLTDIGTFIGSEMIAKISRLALLVIMARALSPAEIGIAALALACGDFFKGLTENGIGQKIVSAKDDQLDAYTNAAHKMGWIWCLSLCALQLALALVIYIFTGQTLLPILIACLAGQFLWMPSGLPSCYLATKAKKLKHIAAINTFQISTSNLLSIALLVIWPTPLSLVLPKLLTAPVWLFLIKKLHPWKPTAVTTTLPIAEILAFSIPVTGIEGLKSLRLHADKILIGAIAGVDVLGAYYFAFNAGLTLATTLSAAFNFVLFPYLCAQKDHRNREVVLKRFMLGVAVIVVPGVILQASLAHLYVPVVFGEEWRYMSPVIAILSFTAIPMILWNAVAQWLRSLGSAKTELAVATTLTIALIFNVLIFTDSGLHSLATGFVLSHLLILGTAIVLFVPKKIQSIHISS